MTLIAVFQVTGAALGIPELQFNGLFDPHPLIFDNRQAFQSNLKHFALPQRRSHELILGSIRLLQQHNLCPLVMDQRPFNEPILPIHSAEVPTKFNINFSSYYELL